MVYSPLNYTGNKAKLLNEIFDILPKDTECFYDVFCGSALVAVNSYAKEIYINDTSVEVLSLIKYFIDTPTEKIISNMEAIIEKYNLTYSRVKPKGTYIEYKHEGLSLYNKVGFNRMKTDYNSATAKDMSVLFALVVYGFNHYLRFNKKGEFNIPIGKVDFCNSIYDKTIDFANAIKQKNVHITNCDFRDEQIYNLDQPPKKLYYFDPPYMITDAPYNLFWTMEHEKALLALLDKMNERGVQFALSNVFYSNGKTNHQLIEWSKKYTVHTMKRQYHNANYRRKNHSLAQEVLITNFEKGEK
ncbi:MAG: Dam family site-specific DNA-(adenine-N6)-methyltransferase [Clostridiales bacterium]|jgi:DNA adenine methylase Dam|nr:Dam family site-specific DNA-(adenine-N6)-methyltransferase [Clostridiales bacterium]